jgi:hypothetical protein
MRKQQCFWPIVTSMAIIMCAGVLVLSAQTDLSGYWAFRVKDGGVDYYQMQQNGETFSTVPPAAGRGGGRGGRGLVGTVKKARCIWRQSLPRRAHRALPPVEALPRVEAPPAPPVLPGGSVRKRASMKDGRATSRATEAIFRLLSLRTNPRLMRCV